MLDVRSDTGLRRFPENSRSRDVFSGGKVYFGEEPRGLGNYDGLCGRGWSE